MIATKGKYETVIEHRRHVLLDRIGRLQENGCRFWLGTLDSNGYGIYATSINRKRYKILAHRAVYIIFKGTINLQIVVDHVCGNRYCVNIDHLQAITSQVNLLRGNTLAARCSKVTQCPAGHPYNKENTYNKPTGRDCKTCMRIRANVFQNRTTTQGSNSSG